MQTRTSLTLEEFLRDRNKERCRNVVDQFYKDFTRGNPYNLDLIESYFCTFHSIFRTQSTDNHNCIGCNLQRNTDTLTQSIQILSESNEINSEILIKTYIWHMHVLIENIIYYMREISLNWFIIEEFDSFGRIKAWANFFKHPKAFAKSHHPVFIFENDFVREWEYENTLLIRENFIKENYKNKTTSENFEPSFTDCSDYIVIFPDIEEINQACINSFRHFVNLVEGNTTYLETLRDKFSFAGYRNRPRDSWAAQQ